MKIGILTFHKAANYGATLQSYALLQVLKNMNADAMIIDYICKEVDESHSPLYVFKRKGFLRGIKNFPIKLRKRILFDGFIRRHLKTTNDRYTKDELERIKNEFKLFIVGSDQVWNDVFSGSDSAFMLDFIDNNEKKYSYAASFGFASIPQKYFEMYKKYLSQFNGLSVREELGREILKNELDLASEVHLDPTLLLSVEYWLKIAKLPSKKNYILIYSVQPPVKMLIFARELSKITNQTILYLNNDYLHNWDLNHIRYAKPEEFIGWFYNADYVITNSYHGTIFSILFHKKMFVEVETKNGYNLRTSDLLNICGLNERIIDNTASNYIERTINWNSVENRLNKKRMESLSYLKTIISN